MFQAMQCYNITDYDHLRITQRLRLSLASVAWPDCQYLWMFGSKSGPRPGLSANTSHARRTQLSQSSQWDFVIFGLVTTTADHSVRAGKYFYLRSHNVNTTQRLRRTGEIEILMKWRHKTPTIKPLLRQPSRSRALNYLSKIFSIEVKIYY